MTQTTTPSELVATLCRHTGRPCAAALQLARKLERMSAVARAAAPDLELTGHTQLDGCARTCPALFHLSSSGIALYCGVDADADPESLAAFAAAFLDPAAGPVATGGPIPDCFVTSDGVLPVPAAGMRVT